MHDRFSLLNDPARWSANAEAPWFNVRGFQHQIDRIVGKNRDGKSIVKLTWMPDVWTFCLGERIKRYWTRRYKTDQSWTYISPPRWALERRVEKSAYFEAHQATRYQVDEKTGEITDLGPPPDDFYVFDDGSLIADHDLFHGTSGEPKCCDDAWNGDIKYEVNARHEMIEHRVNTHRRCWGYYREPNNSDLDRIAEAVKSRDANKYFDPEKPLTVEQLALIEFEANVQAQRIEQQKDELLKEASAEFNLTYGYRLTETDPTVLRHGRQHFMGFNTVTGETLKQTAWQRTEAGIYVSP